MQNSGAIKILILILAVVCAYELSFTFVTKNIEDEAKEQSGGDPIAYRDSLKSQEDKVAFNFLGAKYTYNECKEREINLGLDLRGGVSVTLEVAVDDLVKQLAGPNSKKEEFQEIWKRAVDNQRDSQDDFVTLFYDSYLQSKNAGKTTRSFVSFFRNKDNVEDLPSDSEDSDVLKYLQEMADAAVGESFKILRVRVGHFGIAQPSIKRIGNTGRIMVDLPGVNDVERVRKVLQGSANLQFWDTYTYRELQSVFQQVDKTLIAINSLKKDTSKTVGSGNESTKKDTTESDEFAELLAKDGDEETDSLGSDKNDDVLLEEYRKNNPFISRLSKEGDNRAGAVVLLTDTHYVNEALRMPSVRKFFPRNLKFAWNNEIEATEDGTKYRKITFLKGVNGLKPEMEGDVISSARYGYDQMNNVKEVSLVFKNSAVPIWAKMTRKAAEKKKANREGEPGQIAVVMDDIVYSSPKCESEIIGSQTQISGRADGSNPDWNKDLANILNAGRFKTPVKIVEEAYVGASLGAQAIQASVISFIIALLVVLVYMAFYYSQAGWVANVALLANLFFIVGALAAFPTISLTLPGVAGIVLTIGMSVDANVLIYERIREELRAGKGLKLAIKDGYSNAYTAILDANVTTIATGMILWYFGTGVIEGFAQTLMIGVLTSLFCAIFITRIIFEFLMSKDKKISFATKATESWFKDSTYNIIKSRKKAYLLSGAIILIGIGSFVTRQFDLGADFSGGRTYTVQFENSDATASSIADALSKSFVEDGIELKPEVKEYSSGDVSNQFSITTKYLFNNDSENAGKLVDSALYVGLVNANLVSPDVSYKKFAGDNSNGDKTVGIMNSISIGPTIADDIKASAFTSVVIALAFIFIYVAVRFRKWQFGVGALVAIFHDVLIVLSLFSLFYGILPFSLEINQAFIAAILTVVGYSINDTVVVFDRIREYLGLYPKKDKKELVNKALNSTLSRTFNTSITIFIVLLAIFLFGGSSIKGFSFALLIGVVVGTYSSLFIATPLYVDLIKKDKE